MRLAYYANLNELNPTRRMPLTLPEPEPLSPTSARRFITISPLPSPRDSPLSASPLAGSPISPRDLSPPSQAAAKGAFDLLAVHDRELLAAPQPETPTQAV